MPNALEFRNGDSSSAPADAVFLVTKADAALPQGPCRSLLVGTAGTANITDWSGNLCTNIPLQAGYNPIMCREVRTGGTASDIWALY
jgi:hypothetical protein